MYLSDGVLNAVEKMYYKQVRSGFGYNLIREPIEGVIIIGDIITTSTGSLETD